MATEDRRPTLPRSILVYTALLAAATGLLLGTAGIDVGPLSPGPTWAIAPLIAHLAAAEYLLIRFRYREEIDALNLFEAALAPVLFCYSLPVAVAAVAAGQVIAAVARRNDLVRGSFNVVQWCLATTLAGLTARAIASPGDSTARVLGALFVGLLVAGMTNQLAFTTALRLAQRQPVRRVVAGLGPVVLPGWVAGWAVNVSVGLLFATSFDRWSPAVGLFFVPLLLLHLAEHGYSQALRDRVRLARLHDALRTLADPVDPRLAVADFLESLRSIHRAAAVELVLRDGDSIVRQRIEVGSPALRQWREPMVAGSFVDRLLRVDGPQRVQGRSSGDLRDTLRAEGFNDALTAPLRAAGTVLGELCVYNRSGLIGSGESELAMLDGVARETAAILEKGRAIEARHEEQRTVAAIVDSASDGILAITRDGRITRWNPALEGITGWAADELPDDVLQRLVPRDSEGRPIRLDQWASAPSLPADLQVLGRDGQHRWLACSYGRIQTAAGDGDLLIVVARDVTGAREMERLREEVDRLVEQEAAHREVVHRLQQAVRPKVPSVDETELAVHYLASDPSAPTGGDLYDWQVLPDGSVHLAVVDVMGHGVSATKDALMVTHIFRTLALQGAPLDKIVADAGEVAAALDADLVATALIGRYHPTTGRLRLAGGGHPPAMIVRARGGVEELFAPGIALGWPGAGSNAVVETTLAPGDTVVLYTDGLIEATRDVIQGLRELGRNAARMVHEPVSKLARRLVEESLANAERHDDTLALVLRRARPTSVASGDRFERTYPASEAEVARVRGDATAWLVERAVPADVREDVVLVVSELTTNAERAGASEMTVGFAHVGDCIAIEVRDDGSGFEAASAEGDPFAVDVPLRDMAESGRGLAIVRALVADLSIVGGVDGTVVRCELRGAVAAGEGGPQNEVAQPVRRIDV